MSHVAPLEAERVASCVASRVGVSLAGPRRAKLLAEVGRAMACAGATRAREFLPALERDVERLDELAVTLTVGESYFFRETAQMELLRLRVLPERARVRGPDGTLRFWSAGCSGGQEAYTLAILLAEEGLASRAGSWPLTSRAPGP